MQLYAVQFVRGNFTPLDEIIAYAQGYPNSIRRFFRIKYGWRVELMPTNKVDCKILKINRVGELVEGTISFEQEKK